MDRKQIERAIWKNKKQTEDNQKEIVQLNKAIDKTGSPVPFILSLVSLTVALIALFNSLGN